VFFVFYTCCLNTLVHVSDIDTEELGFDFGVERVLREKKRSRFRHIRRTEVKAQSIYYACVFKYIYT